MPKKKITPKVSPKRVPHAGRRPKARIIGPDVLCAEPMPPKKPRKPRVRKPPAIKGPPRVKKPSAIVSGPSIVPGAAASGSTVSSSTVRAMASSLAAAKFASARRILKEEASMFKTLDMLQSAMFFTAVSTAFVFNQIGLAVSMLAVGTFAPMLIRRGFAKWRDRLVGTSIP